MTFGPINCIRNTIKLWLHVFNLTISNIVLPSSVCIPDELLLVRMLVKVISLEDNQRSHRKCMSLYMCILLVDEAALSSEFSISRFFFFFNGEGQTFCASTMNQCPFSATKDSFHRRMDRCSYNSQGREHN